VKSRTGPRPARIESGFATSDAAARFRAGVWHLGDRIDGGAALMRWPVSHRNSLGSPVSVPESAAVADLSARAGGAGLAKTVIGSPVRSPMPNTGRRR
jgi:hypothetical protein